MDTKEFMTRRYRKDREGESVKEKDINMVSLVQYFLSI